jgi:polysaccharide export outer membrane protein
MIKLFLAAAIAIFCCCAHAENNGEYRLTPGDVAKIVVYDHPDLTTEAPLDKDGMFSFPLIGQVSLNGLSTSDAEHTIAKKLAEGKFINNPQVNVVVTQYRGQRVSVLGEVNRPGRFSLDSATDLLDAIALAGGISAAGGDRILVMREGKTVELNMLNIVQDPKSYANRFSVQNGDIIFVPRMQQVYVYGEVNRPGNFRLEQTMSVMQAVAVAGGYTLRASHRSITIQRRNADGTTLKLSAKPTDVLKENDVVYVEESLF